MNQDMSRRSALRKITGGAAALAAVAGVPRSLQAADEADRPKLKGHIHHSVSAWCYGSLFNAGKNKPAPMTFEDFCRECYKLGLESVELLGPNDWPTVKLVGNGRVAWANAPFMADMPQATPAELMSLPPLPGVKVPSFTVELWM